MKMNSSLIWSWFLLIPSWLESIYWSGITPFFKILVFHQCCHRYSSAVCPPLTFCCPFHWFLFCILLFTSHSFSHSHACLSSREWLHIFARWVFHALICMVSHDLSDYYFVEQMMSSFRLQLLLNRLWLVLPESRSRDTSDFWSELYLWF